MGSAYVFLRLCILVQVSSGLTCTVATASSLDPMTPIPPTFLHRSSRMTIQLAKLKDSFFFISKISSKPKAVYRGFQVVPSYCSRIVSDLCVCVHIRPCSSRNCVSLGHGAVVFQSFPFYMDCLPSHLSAPSRTDGTSASVRATAQAHAPGLIASHSPFFPRPEMQAEPPGFLGSGIHWVLLTESSDPALSSHPMAHSLSVLSG